MRSTCVAIATSDVLLPSIASMGAQPGRLRAAHKTHARRMAVDMDPFLMQSTCQVNFVVNSPRNRGLRAGYSRRISPEGPESVRAGQLLVRGSWRLFQHTR